MRECDSSLLITARNGCVVIIDEKTRNSHHLTPAKARTLAKMLEGTASLLDRRMPQLDCDDSPRAKCEQCSETTSDKFHLCGRAA